MRVWILRALLAFVDRQGWERLFCLCRECFEFFFLQILAVASPDDGGLGGWEEWMDTGRRMYGVNRFGGRRWDSCDWCGWWGKLDIDTEDVPLRYRLIQRPSETAVVPSETVVVCTWCRESPLIPLRCHDGCSLAGLADGATPIYFGYSSNTSRIRCVLIGTVERQGIVFVTEPSTFADLNFIGMKCSTTRRVRSHTRNASSSSSPPSSL